MQARVLARQKIIGRIMRLKSYFCNISNIPLVK
jgi:hypothetical protein